MSVHTATRKPAAYGISYSPRSKNAPVVLAHIARHGIHSTAEAARLAEMIAEGNR